MLPLSLVEESEKRAGWQHIRSKYRVDLIAVELADEAQRLPSGIAGPAEVAADQRHATQPRAHTRRTARPSLGQPDRRQYLRRHCRPQLDLIRRRLPEQSIVADLHLPPFGLLRRAQARARKCAS
jgi:hypothetical protein